MLITVTTRIYSKIPILRPPLGLSKSGLENEEKNNLNLANKVFNR